MITRHEDGRRNRHVVRRDVRFRHPMPGGLRVGDFLDLARRRPRLWWPARDLDAGAGEVDDLGRDAF